jgi:hypothetical protein
MFARFTPHIFSVQLLFAFLVSYVVLRSSFRFLEASVVTLSWDTADIANFRFAGLASAPLTQSFSLPGSSPGTSSPALSFALPLVLAPLALAPARSFSFTLSATVSRAGGGPELARAQTSVTVVMNAAPT